MQLGQWYWFHTNAVGSCPGLDWHAMVDEDRTVSGFVAWDRMRHTATLSGKLNADDSFQSVAREVGGTRTATVGGQVGVGHMTLSVRFCQ